MKIGKNNYKDKDYDDASLLDKLTYGFVSKFVKIVSHRDIKDTDLNKLSSNYKIENSFPPYKEKFMENRSLLISNICKINKKIQIVLIAITILCLEITEVMIQYYFSEFLNESEYLSKMTLANYFGIMVLNTFVLNYLNSLFFYYLSSEFVIIKNNMIMLIGSKMMENKILNSDDLSKGKLINLIQIDCFCLQEACEEIIYSFLVVIMISFSMIIGIYLLSPTFLFFFLIWGSLLIIMITGLLMGKKLNIKTMQMRDKRITLTNTVFTNIRFVKFSALEGYFYKLIDKLRELETRYFNIYNFLYSFIFGFNYLVSLMSSLLFIIIYLSFKKRMTVKVYSAYNNLDAIIKDSFEELPNSVAAIFRLRISFQRLEKFLNLPDIFSNIFSGEVKIENANSSSIINNNKTNKDLSVSKLATPSKSISYSNITDNKKTVIDCRDCSFTYSLNSKEGQPCLKNINLQVQKGEMIFIIGGIGSGKSSLLLSLLGELNQIGDKGKIQINGSTTYLPSNSFLMTKTIRENILYWKDEDPERMKRAIRNSCLSTDLRCFDEGLNKEVLEGGSNFSGGQRARINLAKCFYDEPEIYLLDSPFSALDFRTASSILKNIRSDEFSEKTFVIILQNIQFFKYASKIILMDNGEIHFVGTPKEFEQSSFYHEYLHVIDSHKTPACENPPSEKEKEIEVVKEVPNIVNHRRTSDLVSIKESVDDKLLIKRDTEEITFASLGIDQPNGRKRRLSNMFKLIFKYYGGIFMLIFIILSGFYVKLFTIKFIENVYYIAANDILYDSSDYKNRIFISFAYTILPGFLASLQIFILMKISFKNGRKLHSSMVISNVYGDLCGYHDKISPAVISHRFTFNLNSHDYYIYNYLDDVLLNIGYMIFQINLNKQLTSSVLLVSYFVYYVVIFFIQNKYIKVIKNIYKLEDEKSKPMLNKLIMIYEGATVFRTSNKYDEVMKELMDTVNDRTQCSMSYFGMIAWLHLRMMLMNMFFIEFISFGYILFFVPFDEINAEKLELFIGIITIIMNDSLESLIKFNLLEREVIGLEKCDNLLKIKPEKGYMNLSREKEALIENDDSTPDEFLPIKTTDVFITSNYSISEINNYEFNKTFLHKGHIRVNGINARYPGQESLALKNLSFEILPGEKLGIVGRTGSGKSTILKLLLHYLRKEKGDLFIDDYDINQIDSKKLRSEFLTISQEVTLFEGSLRSNLEFEKTTDLKEQNYTSLKSNKKSKRYVSVNKRNIELSLNISLKNTPESNESSNKNYQNKDFEKEIVQMLIDCGFDKEIEKTGLDYQISIGGSNLSKGEQQLIAFFRVFFTKKQIIFLDEVTAAFDYPTQAKLMKYFNKHISHQTVIAIAHKISSIADFDKILIMEKGAILEYGNREVLLKNPSSVFRQLLDHYNAC